MTAYKRKNPRIGPITVKLTPSPQNQTGDGSSKADETAADKENEGPSMPAKRRRLRFKDTQDVQKVSISEKRRGKQKAKESEDEVEEHVEKKCN